MVVLSFLSKEDSHIKVMGMLVVSLGEVNYRFDLYICPFMYRYFF